MQKIFIANRGEIARRIAMTAKRLGIKTVCITERRIPPRFLADYVDEFIHVEKESVALYLDPEFLIEKAKSVGADAIHPGFGFLSENAGFAKQVQDSALIWIGPLPKTIKQMAHKSEAREFAVRAGVPCIAGRALSRLDQKELLKTVKGLQYPLLVKAALGGGGKGMRIVDEESSLWEEASRAFSEAKSAFGDGTLLIEHFVKQARHVEVQVLGDKHGTVITLGDRDCSVQRRYQKLIEEAPAPRLHSETRKKLHESAKRLAAAADYESAGTVEFLLDAAGGHDREQDFFFLEMNTRLQVEHPVTEAVFDVDIVEWQLRIAQGEAIPEEMGKLKPKGHCIEARIYAEDPQNGFFPSPGIVACFDPFFAPGVRWDLGLDRIDEITSDYDPMIAKVSASGATRLEAIDNLAQSLKKSCFLGPRNNIAFAVELLNHERFKKFEITTHFIADHLASLNQACQEGREKWQKLADLVMEQLSCRTSLLSNAQSSNQVLARSQAIFSRGVAPKSAKSHFTILDESLLTHQRFPGTSFLTGSGVFSKDGPTFFYGRIKARVGHRIILDIEGALFEKELSSKKERSDFKLDEDGNTIQAPVPGKVLKIIKRAGATVKKRETLMILDSMKMEFKVVSSRDGRIANILVTEGDQVQGGQKLIDFEEESA